MRFLEVRLRAAPAILGDVTAFYGERLGLGIAPALRVGETTIEFVPGEGEPFYHVALLVPGDRFVPALAWAAERVELLPDRNGDVVFDFGFWDAQACYFHDPAGNIVELIAHRDIGATGAQGRFEPAEVLGVSELGLVGDPAGLAAQLEDELGLRLWSGSVEGEGRLGFVGVKARTLIVSPPGRGWLPTGRPAEPHPVDAVVTGPRGAETVLAGLYRIRRTPV